jgi:phage repressor protein C with HTH and peptisase S24 domain
MHLSTVDPGAVHFDALDFGGKSWPIAPMSSPQPDAERTRQGLNAYMELHNLKASRWADEAGVARNTLLDFLKGKKDNISLRILHALAKARNATVAEIMRDVSAAEPAMKMVTVPWLDLSTDNYDGAAIGSSRANLPLRFSQALIDEHLDGDLQRGRLFRIVGESFAKELRSGDIVCIDLYRIRYRDDPGLYCVSDGRSTVVRRLAGFPGKAMQMLSDIDSYPSVDTDEGKVRIIGRVVWRSGKL